jgi:hypothetical protein
MYRGYNLKINLNLTNSKQLEELHAVGLNQINKTKVHVRKSLHEFVSKSGVIQGTELQNNWFPEIKSHIFLSHSHQDEKSAIIFAGILYELYKIETFIDSIVWGYSSDLLREIDNEYCRNENNLNYSYEKRNYSSSHVNLMLSTALNKMIDNCECIFFMNTPNSLTADPTKNKTASPWIFSEIATTKIIRKKVPNRITKLSKAFAEPNLLIENLKIEYDLDLSHLTDFDEELFGKWIDLESDSPEQALDNLYSLNSKK